MIERHADVSNHLHLDQTNDTGMIPLPAMATSALAAAAVPFNWTATYVTLHSGTTLTQLSQALLRFFHHNWALKKGGILLFQICSP